MTNRSSDLLDVVAHDAGLHFESHPPAAMEGAYHAHPSVELNYLTGCDMVYSFGTETLTLPRNRICLFWAARPHRVVRVTGEGKIVNAYIPLQTFWSWNLPERFVTAIMAGDVLIAAQECPWDRALSDAWAQEKHQNEGAWKRLHMLELQSRVLRMALDGWNTTGNKRLPREIQAIGGKALQHFDTMLRHVALHYRDPISVSDVAQAAGVSTNYAITLFKRFLGKTLKAHVQSLRLHHAQMLLLDTDEKVLTIAMDSGFRSLSSFHEAFALHTGQTPGAFRQSHVDSGSSPAP